MPKKLIQRLFPDMQSIREHRSMHLFGNLRHDANLWHINRRSVSGAFAVGLFTAFIPVPGQMILAPALAILFRVNLPIATLLIFITNPLTMGPAFFLAHKLGVMILGTPPGNFNFELSFNWLFTELTHAWKPFLLGCFILGSLSALIGYGGIRLYWRIYVLKYRERRRLRKKRNEGAPKGVK